MITKLAHVFTLIPLCPRTHIHPRCAFSHLLFLVIAVHDFALSITLAAIIVDSFPAAPSFPPPLLLKVSLLRMLLKMRRMPSAYRWP